jgi:hypothetical protein
MTPTPHRTASFLCVATLAIASGCAQWQQDPDSVAASFDQRLLAKCASILGDQPMPASQPARRPPTPRILDVAQAKPAPRPAPRQPRVRAAAAEVPVADPAPLAVAKPIVEAPRISETVPAVRTPLPPATHATADDYTDTCCSAGLGEPHAFNCPLLNRCRTCPACLLGQRCVRQLFTRPEPGPPPIRYQPDLPPKFLPVPTQPVLSPARPDAPDSWRGDVEMGWSPRVTFPGND